MEQDVPPPSATWNPAFRPDSEVDLLDDPEPMEDNGFGYIREPKEVRERRASLREELSKSINEYPPAPNFDRAVAAQGEEATPSQPGNSLLDLDAAQFSSEKSLSAQNPGAIASLGVASDVADAWREFDSDLIDFRSPAYTNSFPAVPAREHLNPPTMQPPFHSQAGTSMQAVVEEQEDRSENDAWKDESWSSQQVNHSGGGGYFSEVQTSREETTTPADEEARFEEGLPLVSVAEPATDSNGATIQETPSAFDDNFGGEEGDNFFSQLGQESASAEKIGQPKPLERKTTEQVLNTMDLVTFNSPQVETHMEPILEDHLNHESSGAVTISDGSNPLTASGSDTKEGNLAALWEAALGDDMLDDTVDPSSFFDDNNEGFLEGTNESSTYPDVPALPTPTASTQYIQQQPPQYSQNNITGGASSHPQYAPNGYFAPNAPVATGYNRSESPFSTQPTRPAIVDRAQSFADKSKGGYSSPYDAPMDLSRPKRMQPARSAQIIGRGAPAPAPPPRRNDSLQSNSAISVSSPLPYMPSPTLPHDQGVPPQSIYAANPTNATARPQPKSNQSGFFEDLPSLSKPRASSFGRFAQPVSQPAPPPPPSSFSRQQQHAPAFPPKLAPSSVPAQPGFPRQQQQQYAPAPPHQPTPSSVPAQPSFPIQQQQQYAQPSPSQPPPASALAQQPNQFGLVGPERIMPFAEPAHQAPTPDPAQPNSSVARRYSLGLQIQPNPQSQPSVTASKYSGPVGASIPRAPSVPHQYTPHRPSPLARSASVSQNYRPGEKALGSIDDKAEFPKDARRPSLRTAQTTQTYNPNASANAGSSGRSTHTHPLEQSQVLSPDLRPIEPKEVIQAQIPGVQELAEPPDISKRPKAEPGGPVNDRAPKQTPNPHTVSQHASVPSVARARGNSTNTEVSFIPPEDGREHDQLRRWQGAPIWCWGFGGTIVTSFPQRTPRYAAGQRTPLIKCSPGGIKVRSMKVLSPDELVASFPGPLKSKSKKKEVLEWFHNSIERLESQYVQIAPSSSLDIRQRLEEKILLFKLLAVLIEYDGVFEGNAKAEQAIRRILSPEVEFAGQADQASYESIAPVTGINNLDPMIRSPVTPSTNAIETLRRYLLGGDREKAVWHAVDQKLWGHAMIIASTLTRELGRQVAQEFIRSEVKPAGKNTGPLAALYDVFSGNWEESIDKLVPPSARAGLQMVNKSGPGNPATTGLEGLNRWRETLSLYLSNRSVDDPKAMVALGQLLTSYGRYEAAHICYILSRLPGMFGGPDDPQTSVILLGADHRQQPIDYAKDFESILLTEVYEFLYSVLCSSTSGFSMPHLQAFKLYHVQVLVEQGLLEKAQQYCDAITSAVKGTTKASAYFHPQLLTALEELNARLGQSPKGASGSWMSGASIDKVSGSVWGRLSKFVAGDEENSSSVASGRPDTEGPFANISGDTPPTISRNSSPFGGTYAPYATGATYAPGVPATSPSAVNTRYAPSSTGSTYGSRQPERPNPLNQGYGLLPGSSPNVLRSQLQQPSQPATTMYPSDNERSLPTPPTLSKYSPDNGVQKPLNAMPPTRMSEPQMSPPSSEAGNSRPSTGQGGIPGIGENLLSPNEPRYNPYQPSSTTSDRYSPGYAPRSASYGPRSASLEPRSASYEPMSTTYQPRSYLPSPNPDRPSTSQGEIYQPSAPIYAEYSPEIPTIETPDAGQQGMGHELPEPSPQPVFSYKPGYEPPSATFPLTPSSGYEPTSATFSPATNSSYAPPSVGGYEPPHYATGATDDVTSPKSPRKKKSFMDLSDDEDGFGSRSKKKDKSAKGRDADDAFRRAAEEDAKRDGTSKSGSGGWSLGRLWGGGKPKQEAPKQEVKAHQMKLGDENNLYYDKELKKWVNRNAGPDAAIPSAPTPPPPRGPPSRTVSAAPPPGGVRPSSTAPPIPSGPPSMASSRNASPSLAQGNHASPPDSAETGSVGGAAPAMPGRAASGLAPGAGGAGLASGLVPPSRPGTGMSGVSTASSGIDDLYGGPPQARKGGTVKGKKKARGYVDVMAGKT